MFKLKLFVLLLPVSLSWQNIYADDMATALQETQACLRNQNCASAKTEQGKAVDRHALDAVGGNATYKQELYDISAEIMPVLLEQAGGDPEKMMAVLTKAQTDPEVFMNSLPLELQTRIKSIANLAEKNQPLVK